MVHKALGNICCLLLALLEVNANLGENQFGGVEVVSLIMDLS